LICLSATTVAAPAQPATQPATRPAPEERRDRAAEAAKRIAEAMEAGRGGAFSDEPALGTEELSRRVDVVLLLDCSGSMRFALDAARTQFWRIASSIASAEPQPRLRIGLMAYGRANEQFPMVPLSDDLLDVFDQLMRLDIPRMGGDEWVGEAIAAASGRFWTPEATAAATAMWMDERPLGAEESPPLRLFFIFGNETPHQGPTSAVELARKLPPLGHVNIVHCIHQEHSLPGDAEGWAEVADAGRGVAMRLDTTGDPMLILTPFDKDLAKLNRRLATSYIPLGVFGRGMKERHEAAHLASKEWPRSVAADLAVALAAWQEGQEQWELVERVMEILLASDPVTHEAILNGNDHKVDLTSVQEAVTFVEAELLPAAFKRMTIPERATAVAKAATEREKLREEIKRLGLKRRYWLLRKAAEDAAKRHWRWQLVLDLEQAVRGPLRDVGYEFHDEE
jgi:hypothetical protein